MRTTLLCSIMLILTAPAAPAAEFVVDTTADSVDAVPGDGECADALDRCSLRAAVQEVNALPGMDRIRLFAGSFVFSIAGREEELAATGDLDVTDDVEIVGAGRDSTIVDADALDTVVEIHPGVGQVRLEALTLRNGFYPIENGPTPCGIPGCGAGGLVNAPGAELTLYDVAVRDNRSDRQAGAIFNRGGCVRGDYVAITGNGRLDPDADTAQPWAGAVYSNGEGACLELDHSELADNEGLSAGAILIDDTHLVIQRSLIRNNRGIQTGTFLFNLRNQVLLENVTITGNEGGTETILNDGGSIVHIRNCTITGNSGSLTGGIADVHGGFGLITLSNTLLTGNHSESGDPDCQLGLTSNGGLLIGQAVGSEPFDAGCWVRSGPRDVYDLPLTLEPPADHGGATLSMLPPAQAIDAGVAALCVKVDQRGAARPQGAGCDLGAVEFVTPGLVFEPAELDFGDVDVNAVSEPRSAALHNPGDGNIGELAFSLLGDDGFEIDTGDCGVALPARETCRVTGAFAPLKSGSASAGLEAGAAGDVSVRLDLAGNGVAPEPPEDDIFMDRFRHLATD